MINFWPIMTVRITLQFVIIAFFITFFSCIRENSAEEVLRISSLSMMSGEVGFLSTICDSVELVILEALPTSLIGNISIIRVSDKNILIYDNLGNSILIFNRQGAFRFRLKIENCEKISGIFDARINDDETFSLLKYVYDKSHIYNYNESGELYSHEIFPAGLAFINCKSGLLLLFPTPMNFKNGGSLFSIYDTGFKLVKNQGKGYYGYKRYPEDVQFYSTSYTKDLFCFFDSFTSRVFYFDDSGGLVSIIKIEVDQSLSLPESNRFFAISDVNSYLDFLHISEFFEVDGWIFLTASYQGRYTPLILNRNTGEVKRLIKVDESVKEFGFINDLTPEIVFWPKGSTNSGKLLSYIEDMPRLRKLLRLNDFDFQIKPSGISKSYVGLVNPIVVILH